MCFKVLRLKRLHGLGHLKNLLGLLGLWIVVVAELLLFLLADVLFNDFALHQAVIPFTSRYSEI